MVCPKLRARSLMGGGKYSGMVCIEDYRFSVQPNIYILRCNGFQVIGHTQLDTNTFHTMPQNLTDRVKISGKLVHIGGCAVAGIVEAHMRHTLMPILRLLWVTHV